MGHEQSGIHELSGVEFKVFHLQYPGRTVSEAGGAKVWSRGRKDRLESLTGVGCRLVVKLWGELGLPASKG